MGSSSKEKGYQGEREARRYLERGGYSILAQNYCTPYGEVSIIAQRGEVLSFVEVKSWSSIAPKFLIGSITSAKRKKVLQSSQFFVQKYPEYEGLEFHFDVIFVKGKQITYYSSSLEADNFES